MNATISRNPSWGLFKRLTGTLLALAATWAGLVCAMPRSPLPPYPERVPLYHESFDEDYFAGETNSVLSALGLGCLDESWSGYALQRTGEAVTPFIIPALSSVGSTNVASATGGSLRWWVKSYWSSGVTNGAPATLLEMDAVSGGASAYAWSLQVSADGNTMQLFTETDASVQEVLSAPIAWESGSPHNVILDFSSAATALFIDGSLASQGTGLAPVPLSVGQLVLGSALSGSSTAGADFEEFYSFGNWQSDTNGA